MFEIRVYQPGQQVPSRVVPERTGYKAEATARTIAAKQPDAEVHIVTTGRTQPPRGWTRRMRLDRHTNTFEPAKPPDERQQGAV